jgi:hypothetical protein
MIAGLFLETDGAHPSAEFDPLAVFLAADQLFQRHGGFLGKFSGADHIDGLGQND